VSAPWVPPEPGIHLLIGGQGSGKTLALERLPDRALEATRSRMLSPTALLACPRDPTRAYLEAHFMEMFRRQPHASVVTGGMRAYLAALGAVAYSPPGSLLAFDDFEAGMSPWTLDDLLKEIDLWIWQKPTRVVIATHSPAVVQFMDHRPERVWIKDGLAYEPTRLTDLHDEEWLRENDLAMLFIRGRLRPECGKPKVVTL
jgi:hypothetical protein